MSFRKWETVICNVMLRYRTYCDTSLRIASNRVLQYLEQPAPDSGVEHWRHRSQ